MDFGSSLHLKPSFCRASNLRVFVEIILKFLLDFMTVPCWNNGGISQFKVQYYGEDRRLETTEAFSSPSLTEL
jgi:hypothetical protein